MTCYNFDYAMQMLRQAINFAETEQDFVALRRWANEIEESCHGLEAIETRLNRSSGQDFLLITLQSVADSVFSPEDASTRICLWLNNGLQQDQDSGITKQYLTEDGLSFCCHANVEDGHLESDFEDRISGPDN